MCKNNSTVEVIISNEMASIDSPYLLKYSKGWNFAVLFRGEYINQGETMKNDYLYFITFSRLGVYKMHYKTKQIHFCNIRII